MKIVKARVMSHNLNRIFNLAQTEMVLVVSRDQPVALIKGVKGRDINNIVNQPQSMVWRVASERPERYTRVLCCRYDGYIFTATYTGYQWLDDNLIPHVVTHWMSLPLLPETNEETEP